MVEFSKKSAPVSAGDCWDADTLSRDEWRLLILSATPPPLLLSPVASLNGGDYETCHRSMQQKAGWSWRRGGLVLLLSQGAPSGSISAATEVQHCILFLSVRQLAALTAPVESGAEREKYV